MPPRITGRVPRRSARAPTTGCITPQTTIARENGSAAALRVQWNSWRNAGSNRLYAENENEVTQAHSIDHKRRGERTRVLCVAVSFSWATPYQRLTRPTNGPRAV